MSRSRNTNWKHRRKGWHNGKGLTEHGKRVIRKAHQRRRDEDLEYEAQQRRERNSYREKPP